MACVLFELLLENVSGQRRELRKRLENGTGRTRVLTSNSWFERKIEEENAGTHVFPLKYKKKELTMAFPKHFDFLCAVPHNGNCFCYCNGIVGG